MNAENLTMLTDFYEFTMANGFFVEGYRDKIAYFDMFFRKNPDNGGFAIMAGLEQLIEYFKNLKFEPEDIDYLRSKKIFDEKWYSAGHGMAASDYVIRFDNFDDFMMKYEEAKKMLQELYQPR